MRERERERETERERRLYCESRSDVRHLRRPNGMSCFCNVDDHVVAGSDAAAATVAIDDNPHQ